jgi:hypothetical protein
MGGVMERELLTVRIIERDGGIYALAKNQTGCRPMDHVRAIAELRALARTMTEVVEKQLGSQGAFSLLVQREFMRLVKEKPAIQRSIIQEIKTDGRSE